MLHPSANRQPPASADDSRLAARVLSWIVPGVLIGVIVLLTRGISPLVPYITQESTRRERAVAPALSPPDATLDDRFVVKNYDVTDLVSIGNGTRANREISNELVTLIESSVVPDSWEVLSGPGRITPLNHAGTRMLSISQTRQMHEEVGTFLAVLRRARHSARETNPRPIVVEVDDSPEAKQNARIRRMLDKPIRFDCDGRRLDDAIADLGKRLEIPIRLNRQDISDRGIAVDQPVTVHIRSVSGREALKSVLEPVELLWVIEEGLLKITGIGCEGRVPRVYDVADFVAPIRNHDGSISFDAGPLATAIKTVVRPEEWSIGYSEIHEFHACRIHVLVILQTSSAHQEIAYFLEALRGARRKPAPARPAQKSRTQGAASLQMRHPAASRASL
jgi:hypothetical protein